jgi:hypothetical protein
LWSLALIAGLLLFCGGTAQADPTLSAAPNPVVVAAGEATGITTLTRNDEGPEGFLWVSIDGGEESAVSPDAIAVGGNFAATVEAGKTSEFRLYNAEKDQLLASVSVTTTPQVAPPAVERAKPGGGGIFKGRIKISDALKPGPAFAANFFTGVKVAPRAGIVDITYGTRQPADALIEIAPQKPLAAIDGISVPSSFPAGQKAPPAFAPGTLLTTFALRGDKIAQRSVRLNKLSPNTRYYYVLSARAPDGKLHREWGEFKTLNRVVKVMFDRVLVSEDGLNGNTGRFSFKFSVNDQWLRIPTGNLISFPRDNTFLPIGEKQFRDISTEWTLSGAPDMVPLMVFAQVTGGGIFGQGGNGLFTQNSSTNQDPRPGGENGGATTFTVWNTARDDADASANDNDLPGTYPFTLRTPGGQYAQFEITGRLDVSYPEPPKAAAPRGKINIGNVIRQQGGLRIEPKTKVTTDGKVTDANRFKIFPR